MKLIIPVAIALTTLAFSAIAETRKPYQKYAFLDTCANGPCAINFPAVPTGWRMDISNVSCYAKLLGADAENGAIEYIQLLVLASNGAIVSASTLAPVAVGQGTDSAIPYRTFAANHAVRVYADAGRHFQALLTHNHAAFWELVACHISGELVTVPPP